MPPLLSIIIPTHRRAAILARCLEHLSRQTITKDIEVIVISDDPDPETADVCRRIINSQLSILNYQEVPPCHQGTARNHGAKLATAPLTLLIGDDIFLAPDACEVHLRTHEALTAQSSQLKAVLGYTTWDPALEITPVMKWLETSGWQFGYPAIKRYVHNFIPHNIQHRFTYTSHISLPTKILQKIPFREDVSLYGWEDIEWGMRLKNAGVRLLYEPDAKAFHHHHLTLEESLKRMETLGESVVRIAEVVPEIDRLPRGLKRLAYEIFALLPTMAGHHRRAFLRGIRNTRGKQR
ncbi:MAG: glycosyltransferase [Candidatus Peregrinibacteria bacterium]